MTSLLIFGLLAILSITTAEKCNGREELCHLTLPQVTLAGTHNSAANKAMYLGNPLPVIASPCNWQNQEHSVYKQLKDGIRALDLDLCYRDEYDDHVWACHAGAYVEPLKNVLKEIADYLNKPEYRNEVIFIRFHDADLTEFFDLKADLLRYFNQDGVQLDDNRPRWPTLGEAVKTNKRVYIFVATHTCDSDCRYENSFVRTVNEYHDTWDTWWSASCHKMAAWATTKCQKFVKGYWKPMTYVSVFGTWGACNGLVASTCNQYVNDTVVSCHKEMATDGQTINVIAVDYYKYATSREENVIEVAKYMNELNIDKYYGSRRTSFKSNKLKKGKKVKAA